MRAMLRRLTTLAALLAFGGLDAHAATTMRGYPSLAKRPIEDQPEAPPVESVAPAPVADPALVPEAARLVAQGRAGVTAFDKDVSGTRQAVSRARGTRVSSEAWVQAQVELSALDAVRYDSVAALAGLDTYYVSSMGSGTPVGTALVRERDWLANAVDRQNDALDAMRQSLSQP